MRSAKAQANLYRRIGYEKSSGVFETMAALDTGYAVAAELGRAPLR